MSDNIDYAWVETQLATAKASEEVTKAVKNLLDAWESSEVSPENTELVLDYAKSLIRGHALSSSEGEDEVWVPVRMGFITVGEHVRVRLDAYMGDAGKVHNGRQGRIVALRRGNIVVKTTDSIVPVLDGVTYPAEKLEKRVRS